MEKRTIAGLGGLIAAGIGSICCVGPVLLAGLGFGAGALGFVREFGILHMPMMVMAILLLGAAFYFHNKKNETSANSNSCCEPAPSNKRTNKTFLWLATVLTGFLIILPYLI